ncbi:hypothetical protein HDU93_003742 [Gonapodya sp. JEL0774]|nr:hypothetical protein HDU93_003742 [Gonapodya sp. JEL0774]
METEAPAVETESPEIRWTVAFIASFLKATPSSSSTPSELQLFEDGLTEKLKLLYRGHWYPDQPLRGSGYRSLELPSSRLVLNVAKESGLIIRGDEWGCGIVVWCDPGSVDFRQADRGYTQCVYDASGRRPVVNFQLARGLLSTINSPPARGPSPRSMSPDSRPSSTSPTRGPSPTAPKDFKDRLSQRGVTLKKAEEVKKKEGGKRDKARRDSGYVSPAELADLRLGHSSTPDISVRG